MARIGAVDDRTARKMPRPWRAAWGVVTMCVAASACSGPTNDDRDVAVPSGPRDRETSAEPQDLATTPPEPMQPLPLRPEVELPAWFVPHRPTVVEGVRVFDGETVLEDVDVLLEDGLISAVGEVTTPVDAVVVAGSGRTLVPGLIDSHVHYHPPQGGQAVRATDFGVTTEIDLGTDPALMVEYRQQDDLAAPDLISAGALATAPDGHGAALDPAPVSEPEDADAWVQTRVDERSELVKIVVESRRDLPVLAPETVEGLVEAAHRRGLLAVAHASTLEDTRTAVEAGADGLVHPLEVPEYPTEMIEAIVEREVFTISALGILHHSSDIAALNDDEALAKLRAPDLQQLLSNVIVNSGDADPEAARASLISGSEAGMTVLAGTDQPNPGTLTGLGLVIELELLVAAGMTPGEALVSATSAPSRAWGLHDRGRIEPGLLADLVLVEGEPTEDIEVLRSPVSVFRLGHALEPAA